MAKIENGRPVEPTRYRPVLIELELAPKPSLDGPQARAGSR